MSQVDLIKSKQSHPGLLAQDRPAVPSELKLRQTPTFSSTSMSQTPQHATSAHEFIFTTKPLVQKPTRASYQDSNPLGVNRNTPATVQSSKAEKEIKVRQNGTFTSVAFQEVDQQHVRQRNQNTFNSSVFGDPVPVKPNMKKLEPESAGVGRLFGTD